jgi:magnesium chelatase family protein
MSTVVSRAPVGLAAPLVRVEVHLGCGLPAFALVGLPETVVRESRERVRSAILNSGYEFPSGRITVNLSPADLPKEGGRFDLPIAVGILAASGQLPARAAAGCELYGELALSGELRRTNQLLPALIAGARTEHQLIVPAANDWEASWVAGPQVKVARHLREVCEALRGGARLRCAEAIDYAPARARLDISQVRGQFTAKRALEIAAAGSHAMLMIGPPGAGKTLLAQCLPGLLPPLDEREALEVASLASAAGQRPGAGVEPQGREWPARERPFRSPQHTASIAAVVGGSSLRPGELSLAHHGVLFLDELPEFSRNVLEALREPLESGVVVVGRARRTCEYPAGFQLIAAMNPCPCGYAGESSGRCRCTPGEVGRYRRRLSGPLIDRIDMHVELAHVPVEYLMAGSDALDESSRVRVESSAAIAARVAAARRVQMARQGVLNARLDPVQIGGVCRLDRESRALVAAAIDRLGLSARAYHRVLKLARTCADLAAEHAIRRSDICEAIGLRTLDRAPQGTERYLASETM